MADLKKFLDQQGVSTLWTKVAEKIAADVAAEAKLRDDAVKAEAAARAQAMAAEASRVDLAIADVASDVTDLTTYVGAIPASYTEQTNIVAFIQKRAEEVLAAAQGGSSETAASVKSALDAYVALNDPKVAQNTTDIAAIVADYLKKADKDELAEDIATNADEIARIDAALKLAIDDEDGVGLNSIKDLATWIQEHGEEAAGYAAAISALEALVGDENVAAQIEAAIAAEHLEQFAKIADIEGTLAKVDTEGSVTAAINAAINALSIGDYAKAADLTALAARVTVNEGKIADLEAAGIALAARVKAMEDKVPAWDAAEANAKAYADSLAGNYDAAGSAAAAESRAKAYADGLAVNYDVAGSAATAEANAKTYTDNEINTKVIALTTAEIEAAIASV